MAMTRTDKIFGTIPFIQYDTPNPLKGLIHFNHGLGEIGTDLNKLENLPIPKLYKNGAVKDFATTCPQLQSGSGWSVTDQKWQLEMIEKAKLEHNTSICILSGLSLGGFTGLSMMREAYLKYGHNHFFTAVGLMCAKINNVSTFDVTPYIGVPIKLWHGVLDTTNPISNMRTFKQRVNDAGGNVTLIEYPSLGHNVWDEGYKDINFWAWANPFGQIETSTDYQDGYNAGVIDGTAAGITTGTASGRAARKAEDIAALQAF